MLRRPEWQDEGAIALSSALRSNDALCDLNLHGNRLGGRGAAAIAEVLRPNQRRFNRALTVLYLNLNDLGEQDKAALKRVAAARASLTIHL